MVVLARRLYKKLLGRQRIQVWRRKKVRGEVTQVYKKKATVGGGTAMGSCIKASTNDTPLASPAAYCICE